MHYRVSSSYPWIVVMLNFFTWIRETLIRPFTALALQPNPRWAHLPFSWPRVNNLNQNPNPILCSSTTLEITHQDGFTFHENRVNVSVFFSCEQRIPSHTENGFSRHRQCIRSVPHHPCVRTIWSFALYSTPHFSHGMLQFVDQWD